MTQWHLQYITHPPTYQLTWEKLSHYLLLALLELMNSVVHALTYLSIC